jgi:alpha-galactosidase
MISVLLLLCPDGMQAQTGAPKLDQLKLMQAWIGTWQRVIGKDSVQVLEFQQYGKGFVQDLYLLINGKKSNLGIASYSFSAKEGRFKVFSLMASGNYSTYLVIFTAENTWVQYQVQDFNPEKILSRGEGVLETPTNYTAVIYNSDGVKIAEGKWTKIK